MKITIIGAGNVGTSLASGWAKAGHEIVFGVRNPQDEKAARLRETHPGARVESNLDACLDADVVVLCTPWAGTEAAIRACGNLAGKSVIDATNPLKEDFLALACGFVTSGGEQVAHWATGAQVFKAMNQIGAGLMDHPTLKAGINPVMFVAGEGEGRPKVLQLVSDLGFEGIHVGGLEYSRLLEPLAMLWIHMAVVKGLGPSFAFGMLRK